MTELEELRKKIEEITIDMLSLLKKRNDIAQEIGKIKNQEGMSVSNESRENELRDVVKRKCQEINFDSNTAMKFLNFLYYLLTNLKITRTGSLFYYPSIHAIHQ